MRILGDDFGFDFDREDAGTIDTYLGIDIEHIDDKTLKLSQRNLTMRILAAMNLENSGEADTPASCILEKHEDAPDFDNKQFNYRSVIGMLLYLGNNT